MVRITPPEEIQNLHHHGGNPQYETEKDPPELDGFRRTKLTPAFTLHRQVDRVRRSVRRDGKPGTLVYLNHDDFTTRRVTSRYTVGTVHGCSR